MSLPFLTSVDDLAFGTYKPNEAIPALKQAAELARQRLGKIPGTPVAERTFANTVLALTRATEEFEAIGGIIWHLESVLGKEWEEIAREATQIATKLSNQVGFDKELYRSLKELADAKHPSVTNSKPAQKLLDELIRGYEHDGIDRDEATIARLKAINEELGDAQTSFGQNSVAANDAAGLNVVTHEALAGLDDDFVEACAMAAKTKGVDGYWIQYSQPNYINVMTNCSVAQTRRDFYVVSITRTAALNTDLCDKILSLRAEKAKLLDYASYSDYILYNRMAQNGATAIKLITELTERYKPKAMEEFDQLQAFAREHEHDPGLKLGPEDIDTGLDFYYAKLLREKQLSLNEEELKAYFEMEHVSTVMFETFTTLYGVTFKPGSKPGWHEDVKQYDLFDADGHHIAVVWCDWYAREGKRSGAWMNSYYIAERANNAFDKPHLGYVCGNFTPPRDGKPSLLTIDEVNTMWHEFGHFMHCALGRTELTEQSMGACRWDFIEAPSQIMENWVLKPEVMSRLGKHFETGETLPQDKIDSLQQLNRFRVASAAMRQLNFADTDLALHSVFDPAKDGPAVEYARKRKQPFLPVPVRDDDAWLTAYTHVFAGGYASAYYSYKWAETIEADLFSRFAENGILNPTIGAEYRDKVLARGAEVEPQELIEDFLGRPMKVDALLRRDGIVD